MVDRAVPDARRIAIATVVALIAFASNSILCRLALASARIDPATFTTIRIVAGALALALIASFGRAKRAPTRGRSGWTSAALLFLYAIAFSGSYVS